MADFKDELFKTLENIYEAAKEYGAYAKIQALIAAEESKKQELYYRLGKKYYELYKDAPASDLSEIMNKLLTCDDKIAEYRQILKDSQDAKYTDVSEHEEEDIFEEAPSQEVSSEEVPSQEAVDDVADEVVSSEVVSNETASEDTAQETE